MRDATPVIPIRRTTATSSGPTPQRARRFGTKPAMTKNGSATASKLTTILTRKLSHTCRCVASLGTMLKTCRSVASLRASASMGSFLSSIVLRLVSLPARVRQLGRQCALSRSRGGDLLGCGGHRAAALCDVLDREHHLLGG